MPYKNKNKFLQERTYYHAYNRGYAKKSIFKDKYDYEYFLHLIDKYLERTKDPYIKAFCLMPNHFHFLLFQETKYSMSKFIQVITAEYTRNFNSKYRKEGQLWQGTYRAILIDSPRQMQTTINYIHNNPVDITATPEKYPYCSLGYKYGRFHIDFMKKGRPS